eukprot:3302686-Prorocentrum_lima.AAC.1
MSNVRTYAEIDVVLAGWKAMHNKGQQHGTALVAGRDATILLTDIGPYNLMGYQWLKRMMRHVEEAHEH